MQTNIAFLWTTVKFILKYASKLSELVAKFIYGAYTVNKKLLHASAPVKQILSSIFA